MPCAHAGSKGNCIWWGGDPSQVIVITAILLYHHRLKQWLIGWYCFWGHWALTGCHSWERELLQEVDKNQKCHLTCCTAQNSPQQATGLCLSAAEGRTPCAQPAVKEGAFGVSVLSSKTALLSSQLLALRLFPDPQIVPLSQWQWWLIMMANAYWVLPRCQQCLKRHSCSDPARPPRDSSEVPLPFSLDKYWLKKQPVWEPLSWNALLTFSSKSHAMCGFFPLPRSLLWA